MRKKLLNSQIIDSYVASICGSKIDKVCKLQDNILDKLNNTESILANVVITMAAVIVPTIFCFWIAVSEAPIKVIKIITEPIFWLNLSLEITDTNIESQKRIIKQISADEI